MYGGWLRVWGWLTHWCTLEARRSYGVGLWKIIGIRCGQKKKKTLFRNKLSKGFGFGCRVHIRHDVWYDEPPFLT
jgi:hypothetical protein